jgi:ATP-dependent Clp endopeptidase proteolytic subunit ClpP
MSEETETRTKQEIEADIALKVAEARKMDADVRNIEALIRKNEIEADKAAIELKVKEIDINHKIEKLAKEKAVDDENFVYRFSGEVSGNTVNRCVTKLTEWHRISPECDIEIIFSSPGGSIIDGFELFDHIQSLRNYGHHVTTGTLGYAASMAGILLQAGDTRWIGQQAWMMIHRAAFGAYGKTFEVEDEVKFVKRMEERILDIFTSRSSLSRNKIKRNWERKDWWISADEAVDCKLVDEVRAILPEHSSNKKKGRK